MKPFQDKSVPKRELSVDNPNPLNTDPTQALFELVKTKKHIDAKKTINIVNSEYTGHTK